MPTVKILLKKGETPEDAEKALRKALEMHRQGEAHTSGDTFPDPAMEHIAYSMKELYKRRYQMMLDEILEEIDKEY